MARIRPFRKRRTSLPRVLYALCALLVLGRFVRSMTALLWVAPAGNKTFRVLCTSRVALEFGSYVIRCNDLKVFTEKIFPDVEIDTVRLSQASGRYDATMMVKSNLLWYDYYVPWRSFGTVFIDIVDNFKMVAERIPTRYHVITQNKAQARLYPDHQTHVITHWYNSYPGDSHQERHRTKPAIAENPIPLKLASVWQPLPPVAGCKQLIRNNIPNVRYDCIEEEYFILNWHHKYMTFNSTRVVQSMLEDPQRGPGYVYQQLFRQYDVLVILAKDYPKSEYGNVQRIVSQMCSGVPVLIENHGEAFGEFIRHYDYPCVFQPDETGESFKQAVEKMKSPSLRRQCREQALRIVEDYSPEKIVGEFLQAFGYNTDSSSR